MARPVLCDAGDGLNATKLVHDLSNGEVTGYCDEHWTVLMLASAQAWMEAQQASQPAPVTDPVDVGDPLPFSAADPQGRPQPADMPAPVVKAAPRKRTPAKAHRRGSARGA